MRIPCLRLFQKAFIQQKYCRLALEFLQAYNKKNAGLQKSYCLYPISQAPEVNVLVSKKVSFLPWQGGSNCHLSTIKHHHISQLNEIVV